MTNNEDYIIELLLDTCLVTREQVEEAKAEAKPGQSVVESLISKESVSRDDVLRALATHSSMEYVDLSQMTIAQDVIDIVPIDVARRYKVVPVANVEMGLMMATSDPLNFDTFDAVTHMIGRDVEWVCAAPDQIQAALQKYYGIEETSPGGDIQIEIRDGFDILMTGSVTRVAGGVISPEMFG